MNIINLKWRTGCFLSFFFLLTGCNQLMPTSHQYPFQYSDGIMGTQFNIKVSLLPDAIKADQLKLDIKNKLDEINARMSTYLPESELSRLNLSPPDQWRVVSAPLFQVLATAKRINQQSFGAFDITVGPLVNLWGFGPDPMKFEVPAEALITKKLKQTGAKFLLLNTEDHSVKKTMPGLTLDLSGIAKGYAVDQVAELLEKHGITNYMVEIGGELRLQGMNHKGKPWRIGIEKPTADQVMIEKVISLSNISLATSGDYRNFFELNGVRFSHTIDPRTGSPIKHKLASVTILRDTCMEADAWATALTVLGPIKGFELAEKKQIAALFIIKTAQGFTEKNTSAFTHFFEVES